MKHKEHIRRQAQRHRKRHKNLKKLIEDYPKPKAIWPVFISTFVVVLVGLILFSQWSLIVNQIEERKSIETQVQETWKTHGFKTAVVSTLKINDQTERSYRNMIASLPSRGGLEGIKTSTLLSKKEEGVKTQIGQHVQKSIQVTNALSTGQSFTEFEQVNAKALQKSVLTTFYLGSKMGSEASLLEGDTQLLSQINNALSVDLFAYLNQSPNRADALEGYLNLLKILEDRGKERLNTVNQKIAFLNGSFNSKELQIQGSEQAFFTELQNLQGSQAENQLENFVQLQNENTETKAKIGAYEGIKGYYEFFIPKLTTMIEAVQANRSALIAGVKVVEIENMTLPLIIQP